MAWDLSEERYLEMLRRITALETAFNNMAIAIDNLASNQQVQELLVVVQSEMKDISNTVVGLDNRVTAIEEDPGD